MEETISDVSLRRSNPAAYLRTFLANEIRPDGRKLNTRRPIGEQKHPLCNERIFCHEVHNQCIVFSEDIKKGIISKDGNGSATISLGMFLCVK